MTELTTISLSIGSITWDSAVSIGIALLLVLPALGIWGTKRARLRTLFSPEFQATQDTHATRHQVDVSGAPQRVQLTLRMALNTHVEFVTLLFVGSGTSPTITGLDDWQWGRGKYAPDIQPPYPLPDDPEGRWYWRYVSPNHRFKDSRITIGVDYLAKGHFDGVLEVRMTSVDGQRRQSLPFKVHERSTP